MALLALISSSPHQTITIKLAVLVEWAGGGLASSVDSKLPYHTRTFSPAALKVVVGDAIVAGGHGAGIAVGAGRIVVVRIHPMTLAQ